MNRTQNTITLSRSATGWNARFSGPEAARIRSLMGTDTIPTAYTPQATVASVVADMTRLNPGYIVEVA